MTPDKKNTIEPVLKDPPKTTGEKWFHALRFGIAETVIMGLTAVIAFESSKHGRNNFGPIPNYLKRAEQKFEQWVQPLARRGENGAIVAGALASTMITFHGGNLFAPVMKWLQDNQEKIVTAINKKHGKPGEVEAGQQRLEHRTKETWGDILKGRVASWLMVFTAFVGADMVAGKNAAGKRHFEAFQEKFAEKLTKIVRPGQPVNTAGKLFQYNKIIALDIFATTAAVLLWTSVAKFSAIMRGRKSREAVEEREAFNAGRQSVLNEEAQASSKSKDEPTASQESKTLHASRLGERPTGYRAMAEREAAATSVNAL